MLQEKESQGLIAWKKTVKSSVKLKCCSHFGQPCALESHNTHPSVVTTLWVEIYLLVDPCLVGPF